MRNDLLNRSYSALLAGAKDAHPSVQYDKDGFAQTWNDNLINGLPLAILAQDFKSGAGNELDRKLCAAHSSAALAVNTFGNWRINPSSLDFHGIKGFSSLRYEVQYQTGLSGTAPHLDVVAEGNLPIAIESKCTEWITQKPASFSASYDNLQPIFGHSPWFEQMQQLRAEPNRYKFLDAAQLVKHAFGLLNRYGTGEVWLVYLYWEPRNKWPECVQHRKEADDLANKVAGSPVRLIPMSYRELWNEWELISPPPPQMQYLRLRYDRDV